MKIFWNANHSTSRNEGYRTSSEKISSGLLSLGLDIINPLMGIDNETSSLLSKLNINYENKIDCNPGDILINNVLPSAYKISEGYNIGFSYWETSQLPYSWVVEMNKMDEIWTTSEWAKNVFIDSGVKVPVYSFSLGVEKSLYFPQERKRHYPFTFLSLGSPSTRKNSQIAVNAYLKCFDNDDNYKLIYKSMGTPDARISPGTSQVKSLYNHATISIIEDDLSDEDLAKLYDQVDCLIYPTSGEGWGLFPYQAIAKGIPTICTSGTACTEYVDMSLPLDFEWSSEKISGIYQDSGLWMKPNFDDLCDKMLDVVSNYEKYANFTYENAVKNFDKMTWDFAIEGYYNRLCQILNK